ncbi:MAG: hypothetical protein ACI9O4_001510 [Chitinophagales bacterium]|jgi:hypothetical protein
MKKLIYLLTLLVSSSEFALAQCAMCRASAETSMEAGASDAAGINTGVLYVLAITFGMLGFMGYLLYKGNQATRPIDD